MPFSETNMSEEPDPQSYIEAGFRPLSTETLAAVVVATAVEAGFAMAADQPPTYDHEVAASLLIHTATKLGDIIDRQALMESLFGPGGRLPISYDHLTYVERERLYDKAQKSSAPTKGYAAVEMVNRTAQNVILRYHTPPIT